MRKVVLIDKESPDTYRVYSESHVNETTLCEITGEDCCEGDYTCSLESISEEYRDEYEEGNHVNITLVGDVIVQRGDDQYHNFDWASDEDEAFILSCLEDNPDALKITQYDDFDEIEIQDLSLYRTYIRKNKITDFLSTDQE